MAGVIRTRLRRIPTAGGDVYHAMKASDAGFAGFGEAYFSSVEPGRVKGWKLHRRMTLNFVVPTGAIQVSVHDEGRAVTETCVLGPGSDDTYLRLTIAPGRWVAFGGLAATTSLLLNIASIEHDPEDARTVPIDQFPWKWVAAA